ncbi:hypothetical protein Ae201684P_004520 [Aphanomyces euteiches]|nr:hypothetical protein Ae201684P_004520 [Aphanomyces euteiches]
MTASQVRPSTASTDALWIAARRGDISTVQMLLDEGVNIHRTRWSGVTPLHRACESGDLSTIQLLLDRGADINARSTWGWYSPLHVACRYGREEAVKLLLKWGANWAQKDKRKLTPFKYAIRAGFASMAHRIDEALQKQQQNAPPNECHCPSR